MTNPHNYYQNLAQEDKPQELYEAIYQATEKDNQKTQEMAEKIKTIAQEMENRQK